MEILDNDWQYSNLCQEILLTDNSYRYIRSDVVDPLTEYESVWHTISVHNQVEIYRWIRTQNNRYYYIHTGGSTLIEIHEKLYTIFRMKFNER
jgi:hypothetical protein